jgi:uncharacterized membrane protein YkvA (DUF1232 family)
MTRDTPGPTPFDRLGSWARAVRRDMVTLYLIVRDPGAPWHVRALIAFILVYALSPIDLIPDFVPVVGYLDDLILLPLGILLVLWLLPKELLASVRAEADRHPVALPRWRGGAVLVVGVWMAGVILVLWWLGLV